MTPSIPGDDSESTRKRVELELEGYTEALTGEVMAEASWFATAEACFEELFQRLINVENVLGDVITIVKDNAMQPATMAEKLSALFDVPDDWEPPQAPKEG